MFWLDIPPSFEKLAKKLCSTVVHSTMEHSMIVFINILQVKQNKMSPFLILMLSIEVPFLLKCLVFYLLYDFDANNDPGTDDGGACTNCNTALPAVFQNNIFTTILRFAIWLINGDESLGMGSPFNNKRCYLHFLQSYKFYLFPAFW